MACQLIASGNVPNVVLKALLYPGVIKRFFTQGTGIPSPDQLLNSYKYKMRDAPTTSTSDLKYLEVRILFSLWITNGYMLNLLAFQDIHVDNFYLQKFWNFLASFSQTSWIDEMQTCFLICKSILKQVIAGSYLSVAGALVGLIKRGRMSLFGSTLILWGILREIFIRNHASHPSKPLSIYPEMIITIIFAFFSAKRDVRRIMRICKPDRIFKRQNKFFKAKSIWA